MFERFTANARRVLALAQEEARFLGHAYCGSEHLLLGLLRDEGPAGEALARQGIRLDPGRKAVAAIRGRAEVQRKPVGAGSLPFSANAKAAVQSAVDQAQASQGAVDSNHLLFGLLRDQSPAVRAVLEQIRTAQHAAPPVPPTGTPVAPGAPATASVEPLATAPRSPATLEARVDELTQRVDRLQALVHQLAQRSPVR